jgi:UDP-N-acetylglucosamine 3-dehydrogenase
MNKKPKAAVIGAGNMGRHHVRIYSEICNLVAVADLNEKIGKPLADKFKTRFYTDYKKMLDKEKPDMVSIVVPTKFHKEVAFECLKRKIPILVEKPLSDSIIDAQEILNEARRNNTIVMVGHLERFNPGVIKLKEIINSEKLGQVISLLAIRVGISPPNALSSDVVLDLAIHDIDIFNYLMDEYPIEETILRHRIFKNSFSDSASILLQYPKASAIIQTNWITPIKMRKLYVTGTDGFAELDYITQKLIVYDKIIQKKKEGNFFEFLSLYELPKKEVYVSKKEPLKEELLYFKLHVKNKLKIDAAYALQAVKTALQNI